MCTRSGPRMPLSFCPLLPPGSLPPSSVLVSLCLCAVLPLLCCPLSLFLTSLTKVLSLSFGFSLSFCRFFRVLAAFWWFGPLPFSAFGCVLFGCYPTSLVLGGSPSTPFCLPPLWFWCLVCRVLVCRCGASCLVLCVRVDGIVGPASSHGLDCTAVNFTGADQWSSLPCRPERPRAAKSAHMVPSVESSGILHLCALLQPFTDNWDRAALLQTVLGR